MKIKIPQTKAYTIQPKQDWEKSGAANAFITKKKKKKKEKKRFLINNLTLHLKEIEE